MVCGPGQGWGNQNQTGRQGGVKRASEKRWGGGRDSLGFEISGSKSGKPNFPQLNGLGLGVGDKIFITGTIGDSSFRSTARVAWGWGGARLGWGPPVSD